MRKLSILFIITGVLIILATTGGKIYNWYMQQKLIWDAEITEALYDDADDEDALNDYLNLHESFLEDNVSIKASTPTLPITPAASPAVETTKLPALTASAKAAKKTPAPVRPITKQILLGTLKLPKIKLTVPVMEGVKPENLRYSVGHIPGTAPFGAVGNCAIAGHRNYAFGKYFNRLDELKTGDEAILESHSKVYRYIVYKKLVVQPNDPSVLKKSGNEKILTLITCTPKYIATHRLILQAKLVE